MDKNYLRKYLSGPRGYREFQERTLDLCSINIVLVLFFSINRSFSQHVTETLCTDLTPLQSFVSDVVLFQ